MHVSTLLSELKTLGVELTVNDSRLRVRAPQGVLTAAHQQQLRDNKEAIIAFLQTPSQDESVHDQPWSQRRQCAALPLSFAQQRLWFLTQLDAVAGAYNMPFALSLTGALEVAALEQCLQIIEQRHAVLRTTIVEQEGAPRQEIHEARFQLRLIDLDVLDPTLQATTLQQQLTAEAKAPFDLTTGPLWRGLLWRLQPERHVLLVVVHHIIADGWSINLLQQELAALYLAVITGQPAPLTPLPCQFVDYARWEQAQVQTAEVQQALVYWQAQLAGAPTLLALPTDYPRPTTMRYRGDHLRFTLSPQVTAQLTALCRQQGITRFMLLEAAFALLLMRYTNQDDILVGTPVANREQAATERLLGYFVNTLVLRNDLSGNPTFTQLLQRVRDMAVAAYQHQTLPFDLLMETLKVERSLRHPPLFQVMFVLNSEQPLLAKLGDLTVAPVDFQVPTAKFDLTLYLEETTTGLQGWWEYNNDLFAPTTIARLSGHFQTLLAGIVANPAQRLSDLPLLTPAERHQLLVEWASPSSATSASVAELGEATGHSIHQWFEAQVVRTPAAVAVVMAEDQKPRRGGEAAAGRDTQPIQNPKSKIQNYLTYAELNARANQLAHHLQSLGVGGPLGTEALVGLCVERSIELVVGILGILKAGGAYVPLDPTYPPERLAFIVEDAQLAVIVTQTHLQAQLPPSACPVVTLDDETSELAQAPMTNPVTSAAPQHLAYVIYTSGSTGNPKGVLVTHANVVRLFRATEPWFGFNQNDVWTLFHSYAFDFSVWELWGALLYGGKVVVVPYLVSRAPEAFYQLLNDYGVTVLNQTPSAFYQLMQAEEAHDRVRGWQGDKANMLGDNVTLSPPHPVIPSPLALRYVIFGGEALNLAALAPWFAQHGDTTPQLVNMYGITETTVHVTYRPLRAADVTLPGSVIGAPIPDLQLYILDPQQQPVPLGVVGELYVGGAGVSRGYLNRPELTAARFLSNPYGPGLLYRSGDLARWLSISQTIPQAAPDIEYLGRIDNQVKIRGFRIELGEIEAAITQYPAVREALVLAREDEPGAKRLVAYIVVRKREEGGGMPDAVAATPVLRSSSSFLPVDLRSYLQTKLPDHMVPTAFVLLDSLPLTANGKVDRKALPAPPSIVDGYGGGGPPRTQREALLADIWRTLLKLDAVGIEDNFFAVGGHSLLATQVVSRIRQLLAVELPVRVLFENPTIAELATQLDQGAHPLLPPLAPLPRPPQLPLSFAQQQLWFFTQFEPASALYNLPAALHLRGPLDLVALERSLQTVEARHEALRTTFVALDGVPYQQIHAPAFRLTVCALTACPAAERTAALHQLVQTEANYRFDLAQEPLWRVTLVQLADEEAVLLVTLHHIIADGWSLDIFTREISACYAAFVHGETPNLPPLPVQYADFALWQRTWLQGDVLAEQLAYWRRQLQDAPPLLDVPTDYPRPAAQHYRGAEMSLTLPDVTSAQLDAFCQAQGVTLFMLLEAVFAVLLARYSGMDDILIGTPHANREQEAVEGVIGFFVNTLVLRNELTGDPTFVEFLQRVRAMTLAAYQYQAVPFELLIDELQLPRSLSYNPLIQTLFTVQTVAQAQIVLPGVVITEQAIEHPVAAFDLILNLRIAKDGLHGICQYNSDLFAPATMARLLGHFTVLLNAVLETPHTPVSRLPLLTTAEVEQLLVTWNATAHPYPADRCAHHLVEEQAQQRPEQIAVTFEGQHLTYRQLNQRANQLAHRLIALGVGPNRVVALFVERSLEMIVGLLAILKAGGLYLPLDPGYPAERLTWMLDDSQATLLLTQQSLVGKLTVAQTVYIDEDADDLATHTAALLENPWTTVQPTDFAYMIYTSGSTGRPKGVSVMHHALNNTTMGQIARFQLKATSKLLQFVALSYDVATGEIFMALQAGATLHLVSREAASGSDLLLDEIERAQITHAEIPPSLLAVLPARPLPLLETLGMGGEPCALQVIERWGPGRRLLNLYGPSETTITATTAEVRAGTGRTPPIGRPLYNTQLYILDAHRQPVPIGVAGELYIGGVGVAVGYWQQPALTAEHFFPNPFDKLRASPFDKLRASPFDRRGASPLDTRGASPLDTRGASPLDTRGASKLYRTGDLCRYLPDGNVEFLGRVDQQVKIRGLRIELGEIETWLTQHPQVKEAVVLVDEATHGKQLVAYYVGEATADDLRAYLGAALPGHMIPAIFMPLAALPRTPNDKIDRRALPAPQAAPLPEVTPGRNDVERQLTGLWQELLQRPQVGIHNNFFELGGHSLQAVQLAARMTTLLGQTITVKALFQHPTIAGLMDALAEQPAPVATQSDIVRQPNADPNAPTPAALAVLEQRPLLTLWATQALAPVDAVAIGYFPAQVLNELALPKAAAMAYLCGGELPAWNRIVTTAWGRIGIIDLPLVDHELFDAPALLRRQIEQALRLAQRIGARAVALTGELSAATNDGQDLALTAALPPVTTGYETTCASVVLAVEQMLQLSGRRLAQERVGLVGLGPIGLTVLRCLLQILPHPQQLLLCDLYAPPANMVQELRQETGFTGEITVAAGGGMVPSAIYAASLLIAATNVPQVIEVARLVPGTLLVEYSTNHSFDVAQAIARLETHCDILFTDGGVLHTPAPVDETVYLPRYLTDRLGTEPMTALRAYQPQQMRGCVLSSLLLARSASLASIIGAPTSAVTWQVYQTLCAMGFTAAALHCAAYQLPAALIEQFRQHYGGERIANP